MNYKQLAIVPLLLLCLLTTAQKGTIKGTLKDSATKQILSLATITVFTAKDTSIVSYRLSDPAGIYQVPGIPFNILCRVVITFQGYRIYRKEFELTKEQQTLDLGTTYLVKDPKSMDEVIVYAERPPISMRNDTLEFNANAFKTLPSAVVEDLLKKLPGVDVDQDGNITVKGKKVNRLVVDGKEFFGGDPKVATRNLPANIVDKIQVSDDKEELENNPLINKDQLGQIINIKLKKAIKQGWFGKAYGGLGTDDRHETGAIVNMFKDTLQVSILGYSNNINKPGFNISDIQNIGGFNRSGVNSIGVWSDGGFEVNGNSFGATGQGLQHSFGGGLNFNNQYGKKLTLNMQYFYGQINSNYDQISNSQRFLKDTVLTSPSTYSRENVSGNHRLAGNVIWKIDSLTRLTFRPGITVTHSNSNGVSNANTTDNFKGIVNETFNNNFSDGNGYNYRHNLSINRVFKKKGRSLNIYSDFGINDNANNNYSEGTYSFYTSGSKRDSLLNQLRDRGNGGIQSNLNVSFIEPLSKKTSLTLTHSAEYIKSDELLEFYNRDDISLKYDVYSSQFSYGVKRKGWKNTSSATFSYQNKKLTVRPGVNFYWLNLNNSFTKNPTVSIDKFYVYPSLSVNWKSFNISYRVNIREPQSTELQRVIDTSNVFYKSFGNPSLQPTYARSFSLYYYKYKPTSGSSLNVSLNGSFSDNSIMRTSSFDVRRIQSSMPVNVDGARSFSVNVNYNRQYKFNKDFRATLRPYAYVSNDKSFISVNGNASSVESYRVSFYPAFGLNYKDKIEWNQRYTLYYQDTRYSDKKNYKPLSVATHGIETELVLRWPKHFVWESMVNYTYNPQVSASIRKSFTRWNGGLNYLFLKEDKGQLKLSFYDLLNQNRNVSRSVYENYISDYQTTTLQRYFMLSFTYNIRNFSGGKVGGKDRSFGIW